MSAVGRMAYFEAYRMLADATAWTAHGGFCKTANPDFEAALAAANVAYSAAHRSSEARRRHQITLAKDVRRKRFSETGSTVAPKLYLLVASTWIISRATIPPPDSLGFTHAAPSPPQLCGLCLPVDHCVLLRV